MSALSEFMPFFLVLLSIVNGLLGWLMRELWGNVKKLTQNIEDLRVHIAEEYVRQDRMERAMEKAIQPVLSSIERIERTLTGKVDKP